MADNDCTYRRMANIAVNEGKDLGKYRDKSIEECKEICDSVDKCKSFHYEDNENHVLPSTCTLSDGMFTGNEPEREFEEIFTVYKVCGK